MNILFAEPRYYTSKTQPHFPTGPAYIAAALLQAGHRIDVVNANRVDGPYEACRDAVLDKLAGDDFQCFAMGGLCTTFTFQRHLFRDVRAARPDIVLVGGGNLFSSEPELCFRQFGLDFGVIGEGEDTMTELCRALESGQDPAGVDGLFLDARGALTATPRRKVRRDLDSLPFPAWEAFLTDQEIAGAESMPVYTSRSCPFHCTFCYHPRDSFYRKRSVEGVLREIRLLVERFGIRTVGIGDELFALDKAWALRFCEGIGELGLEWLCQTRASDADLEVLTAMRRSGCRQVSMGFESGSDPILRSMKKKIDTAVSRAAIANVRAAGLPVTGGVIIGDFEETPETVRQTVAFVQETALVPVTDVGLIVPYPGSTIYDRCLREGLIPDKLAFIESLCDFDKLRVNMTRSSDAELLGLQEWASREIYGFLSSTYHGVVEETLESRPGFTAFSCRCPTCREVFRHAVGGMPVEIQAYCPACRYPVFISPFDVAHIARATRRFRERLADLDRREARLMVTPVGHDFMRLSGLVPVALDRVAGFLDASPNRLKHPFLGRPVFARTRPVIKEHAPAAVVVCSVAYGGAIAAELAAMDVAGVEILSFTDAGDAG